MQKKFLGELEKGRPTNEKEWVEICKLSSAELLALSDTIKIPMQLMKSISTMKAPLQAVF